jgi:hypothetical protein
MKKSDFLFFTKGPNLFTQFSDSTQSIEALRLDQELEFTIGDAFVQFWHEKFGPSIAFIKFAIPVHSSTPMAYF